MSVQETHAALEQFKQAFFADPTDIDGCQAMLPKLKVRSSHRPPPRLSL
jgi:hypothetical protein